MASAVVAAQVNQTASSALCEKIFPLHVSDIFISYATADRSRVKPLVDQLQRRGWSVWWDRTIQPGKTWDEVIEVALTEARCVLVLWSRESVQSDWVKAEADDARRRGILVPALLDDVTIPLGFRRIQAANLINCSGVFAGVEFDELLRAVADLVGHRGPDAPQAATGAREPVLVASKTASRRTLALIGGLVVACLAAFGLYFASRAAGEKPRVERPPAQSKVAPSPSASSTVDLSSKMPLNSPPPVHVHEDAKAESLAIRPPASPRSGTVSVPVPPRISPTDGLTYVYIPPGTFTMGCSPGDSECFKNEKPPNIDEKPPHTEKIGRGFWLSQTEVTQEAWEKVMGGNPSHFTGAQLPVEGVNWNEAFEYCRKIGGRLPTENEWEYAARAGTAGARYGALDAIAWYRDNSGMKTHPVGVKQANAWGLYDMLGNVVEWTADDYDAKTKMMRGGSWWGFSGFARASAPDRLGAINRSDNVGVRCVGDLRWLRPH